MADAARQLSAGVSPLRLGWIIDSLATGGAERLAVTFAEEAAQRADVDLTVFTLSDDASPFRKALERLDVPVLALPGRSSVDPLRFLRVVEALRSHSIEMVHAHLTTSTIVAGAACALTGRPLAVTIHNVRPSVERVGRLRGLLYRWALRRAAATRIAVGRAVAEANAPDAGGRPFVVVPNAVAPSAVWAGADRDATRRELGLAANEVMLIAVGLLISQKGYPDLVEAFLRIAERFPTTRLLVVGASAWLEMERDLRDEIARRGLTERVTFLGARSDVPRLLAASDLFVSGSHWEGAPVSLLEAMANGLPCVVTDVGDCRLMLQGTGAPIPPPNDPQALADALAQMLGDPERRRACGEAARRRAREHYGVERWVDRLLEVYAELTPRKDWLGDAHPRALGAEAANVEPAVR